MTDRSDADRELDEAIARHVRDAGADAPEPPSTSALHATTRPGPSGASATRRLVALGAIGLTGVAAAALVFVVLDDDQTGTLRPIDSSPSSAAVSVDDAVAPTSGPRPSGSSAPRPSRRPFQRRPPAPQHRQASPVQ
jgi:hypothetical protein